jgi:hypothetical protein
MAKINKEQVARVARLLKELPASGQGLNFYSFGKGDKEIIASDMYPDLYNPQAVNFFFFGVLHDFGFWYGDEKGYLEPLYGTFNGEKRKGADSLWRMCRLALANHKGFDPKHLANITVKELAEIFSDDNGPVPWPNFETRFKMTRAFGKWFIQNRTTSLDIVRRANEEEQPLREFLFWMRMIPGYDEDFLQKRNLLLAMVLANRPEKFLKIRDPQNWRPIVDYHLMRTSLRLGLVELDEKDREKNEKREWISAETERLIRLPVYDAVGDVIKKSDKPMSFIDEKMWMARKYCPETEPPDCSKCIFDSVCKKRVAFFQPVFRTTAY